MEWFGEVLGNEQGKIGVVGLAGVVLEAVAIDRHDAVGVLIDHDAVRVHAEGAYVVLVLLGAIDDLALVELVGDVLEDDGGQLNTHAEVYAVRVRLDAQLFAHALHPRAAAAPDRYDAVAALGDLIANVHAIPLVLTQRFDGVHRCPKVEVHVLAEQLVEVAEHHIVDVGAQVAHRRLEQGEVVLHAELLDVAACRGVERRARAAMGHVDVVDVAHEGERLVASDVVVERAAEVIGDVVLSIGESTCATKAAHDCAGWATDAALDALAVDRAVPAFEGIACLEDAHAQVGSQLHELPCRKDAAGTCSHDNDVVVLHVRASRWVPEMPLRPWWFRIAASVILAVQVLDPRGCDERA